MSQNSSSIYFWSRQVGLTSGFLRLYPTQRMEGWVNPDPGCKEQLELAQGCYMTTCGQQDLNPDLTIISRARLTTRLSCQQCVCTCVFISRWCRRDICRRWRRWQAVHLPRVLLTLTTATNQQTSLNQRLSAGQIYGHLLDERSALHSVQFFLHTGSSCILCVQCPRISSN